MLRKMKSIISLGKIVYKNIYVVNVIYYVTLQISCCGCCKDTQPLSQSHRLSVIAKM